MLLRFLRGQLSVGLQLYSGVKLWHIMTCISLRPKYEAVDANIEYIELSSEGPAGEDKVIVVEHEPEPSVEVTPSEIDHGKHCSIYAY